MAKVTAKHSNNFAAHTLVLSKQSSIRDSVDAAYHMRLYQVKNTHYYYCKIVYHLSISKLNIKIDLDAPYASYDMLIE